MNIIIVDEHVLINTNLLKAITIFVVTREAFAKSLVEREPTMACEEEYDSRYHNWKDFIQNPARPGRQIKKQKPPKQSFKAQMRSVNRNR